MRDTSDTLNEEASRRRRDVVTSCTLAVLACVLVLVLVLVFFSRIDICNVLARGGGGGGGGLFVFNLFVFNDTIEGQD
jgi:hypothetical protein